MRGAVDARARALAAVAAVLAVATTLGACASGPIESDALPELSPAPSEVVLSPETASGTVLWGGTVIGARNLEDTTQLEVLAYPLDRRQRPRTGRDSDGRFLIVAEGYLETLDYAEGRLITVLGALDGVREGRVGEATRVYPAVRSEELHLWRGGDEPERPRFTFGIGVNLGN